MISSGNTVKDDKKNTRAVNSEQLAFERNTNFGGMPYLLAVSEHRVQEWAHHFQRLDLKK